MIDPRRFDEYKKFFAEYQVLVKGELDAEYKRNAAQLAELDKRLNYAEAARQLKSDQTDLSAAQDAFAKTKAAQEKKLADWEAELTKRETQLANTLQIHADEKRALSSDKSAHEAMADGMKAALAQREKDIAEKERSLQEYQGILHARDLKLAEKEARVDKALSLLKESKV